MELINQHISRQIDLIPTKILKEQITIIGAGAIGSFAAMSLAKMGFERLTVIDFDDVDIVNMSCQFYGFQDIGMPKVDALKRNIETMSGGTTRVNAINAKWEGQTFAGIVVAAVDSLETRRAIWDAHLMSFQTKFIIDPRMGAEVASLYVMNPHNDRDRKTYPKSLTSDDEAIQLPCTQKSTTFTAIMLGSLVSQSIRDCLMSSKYPRAIDWSLKDYQFRCFSSDYSSVPSMVQ
jgi:molybdopterin/thiamine biosynthesis adenylyltransferase